MERRSVETIVGALDAAGVRYPIVGGLAVAAHGYVRFTAATEIDLFVEPPFDFESAYARAARFALAPGLQATFVGLADLLDMKRTAGRPQDHQDLEALLTLPPAGGDAHE